MIGNSGKSQANDRAGRRCSRRVVRCPAVAVGLTILLVIQQGDRAAAAPTFTNVTAALGITHVQNAAAGTEAMTGGAAAGDFDGDGLIDLFFTRVDATDVLYRNTGSGFEDVSAAAGFTEVLPTSGVAAGDVDNDGDLDLYVTASSHNRFYLYMNDGAGHFSEQASSRDAAVMAGGSTTWRGMGVAFGDYDRDGFLDILTSDHSRPTANNGSRLLRNLGAANPGHFEDVTQAAGLNVYRAPLAVPNTVYRFQPQFTDLDRDGHTDIVFSADSRTSQLFWNNGDGTFTDGTSAAGVGTDKSGMGTTLGDYDHDGDLDWFITAIMDTPFVGVNPGNRLYRNNGNRTFTDVTTAAGVRNSGSPEDDAWGWGTTFLDYDNDADQDLIATNGFVAVHGTNDRTTLWRNNDNGTFTDVAEVSGITDRGQGRGLLRLDYDVDGDVDVLVVNYGATPILYRNDGGNDANWLRVETEGTVSNRDGIGALITVVPDAANPSDFQIWEIGSGSSYLSQEEMTAHFGLGSLSGTVDKVTVEWTSGLLQTYVDVPINSTLQAQERLLGDYNGDTVVDAADYTVWRNSMGLTGVGLPADGAGGPNGLPDGVVDHRDYTYWKANFGLSFASGGGAAARAIVPEPGSLTLLFVWGGAVYLKFPGLRRRVLAINRIGEEA